MYSLQRHPALCQLPVPLSRSTLGSFPSWHHTLCQRTQSSREEQVGHALWSRSLGWRISSLLIHPCGFPRYICIGIVHLESYFFSVLQLRILSRHFQNCHKDACLITFVTVSWFSSLPWANWAQTSDCFAFPSVSTSLCQLRPRILWSKAVRSASFQGFPRCLRSGTQPRRPGTRLCSARSCASLGSCALCTLQPRCPIKIMMMVVSCFYEEWVKQNVESIIGWLRLVRSWWKGNIGEWGRWESQEFNGITWAGYDSARTWVDWVRAWD